MMFFRFQKKLFMINVLLTILLAFFMAIGQTSLNLTSSILFANSKLNIIEVMHSKWLWISIAIYIFCFIFWIYILSRFDIKFAYPISTSAIFMVALINSYLHNQSLPITYWIGLVLVVSGLSIAAFGANHN
jgi:undecaprenyl phosphate-alpha-L-ara4N flippase subunit ArnE